MKRSISPGMANVHGVVTTGPLTKWGGVSGGSSSQHVGPPSGGVPYLGSGEPFGDTMSARVVLGGNGRRSLLGVPSGATTAEARSRFLLLSSMGWAGGTSASALRLLPCWC